MILGLHQFSSDNPVMLHSIPDHTAILVVFHMDNAVSQVLWIIQHIKRIFNCSTNRFDQQYKGSENALRVSYQLLYANLVSASA